MSDIKQGQWYPTGTPIDFTVHGFHLPNKSFFSIKLQDGSLVENCTYEGYDDLFNTKGMLVCGVTEFMLQDGRISSTVALET